MKPPTTQSSHGFRRDPPLMSSSRKATAINGPRPSPLNTHSHTIRKKDPNLNPTREVIQRKPIIIYTHSPKIIHTTPHQFMSLVQNLTGMPRPIKRHVVKEQPQPADFECQQPNNNTTTSSSSSLTTSSAAANNNNNNNVDDDDIIIADKFNHGGYYGPDVPLFTPNFSDFLSPSRSLLKYSENSSPFGILGSLISPSALEFIHGLPEY